MGNNPTDAGKLRYHCENIVNDDRYADLDRMTYLTNHDVNFNDNGNKLSEMYSDNKYIFTVLIFTFYGMPLIYNGQEVGGDQILDYFLDTKIDWTTSPDYKMYNTIRTLTAMKHSVNAFRDGKSRKKEER